MREQLQEDMWYAVMTEDNDIRLTTKSYNIACCVAVDTDTVAVVQKIYNVDKPFDNYD